MIFSILLFISILFLLRFNSFFRLKDCSSWTLSIAFFIKISVAFLFYYIYVYNIGQNQAPSDAIRFMQESKMLFNVFTSSKSDYLSLLTGIGDNIEIRSYGEQISFSCTGDIASQTTTIGQSDIGGLSVINENTSNIVQGIYALKYLVLFTKCTNLCNTIELFLKNDYPLIIQYAVASL